MFESIKIDDLLASKIADCYTSGKSWPEISIQFPDVTIEIYEQITQIISNYIKSDLDLLRPNYFYYGMGVEFETSSKGLIIKQVYKNSPAAKLGLEVNDIIVNLNNDNLADLNFKEALNILRSNDLEQELVIEIVRDNRLLTRGQGTKIKRVLIDAKRKQPINFLALALGKKIIQSQVLSVETFNKKQLKNEKEKIFEIY